MKINSAFRFVIVILVFQGCSWLPSGTRLDKNSNALEKQNQKIETTIGKLNKIDDSVEKQAAILSAGIKISLSSVTNKTIETDTASSLNNRIISLFNNPSLDEYKKIDLTVQLLNSSIKEERARGEKLLTERDLIIFELQKQNDTLNSKYDKELKEYADKAKKIATKADESQAVLNELEGWAGIKAILYGFKHFFAVSLYWVVGFCVIYLFLRVFASSSPIVSACFSGIEGIFSIIISTVKVLAPKAAQLASLVPKADYTKYKTLCFKVVDNIAELKHNTKISPEKTYSLQEVLDKFSEDFDQSDKDLVEELTIETKWKK